MRTSVLVHGSRSRRRRRALAVGLLVLAAAVVVAVIWLQRRSDRAEGIQLALDGKMDTAEPLLAAALTRDAKDVEVLRAQALGRLSAGKVAEAEEPLERWRALRLDDPEPHRARIAWALRLDRLPEAVDAARTILALQPDDHDLREQLAYWLVTIGRTDEADIECRRCRRRRPDDPSLAFLQAEIWHRLGENTQAEELVDRLLQVQPAAPVQVLRGALHLDAGQPEKAVPLLRKALAQRPEGQQQRARHYLSLALAQTGQEAEARKVLAEGQRQQAVALWEKYGRSESVAYKVSIAEALLATGQTGEAVQLLERAVAQAPGCVAAHRLLAAHYEAQGQPAKAAEHRRLAGE
jgi:predicted Zn-dependent protease